MYLDWEAKCEQIFEIHEIQDEHKLKLATLEFSDYAMKWWHGIVKDIIYHKGPPVSRLFREPYHPEVVPLPLHLKEVKKYVNRGCAPQKAKEYVEGFDESPAIRVQLGGSSINLCQ